MTRYWVSFEIFGERPAAALDIPELDWTLDEALARACQLIAEGKDNVKIADADGRSITVPDLYACCTGEKKLTPDLRAV
jgi:hypothetical protein